DGREILEEVARGTRRLRLETVRPAERDRGVTDRQERNARRGDCARRPPRRQTGAVLECVQRDPGEGCRAEAERDRGPTLKDVERGRGRTCLRAEPPCTRHRQ